MQPHLAGVLAQASDTALERLCGWSDPAKDAGPQCQPIHQTQPHADIPGHRAAVKKDAKKRGEVPVEAEAKRSSGNKYRKKGDGAPNASKLGSVLNCQ